MDPAHEESPLAGHLGAPIESVSSITDSAEPRILTPEECDGLNYELVQYIYDETGHLEFAKVYARAQTETMDAPRGKVFQAERKATFRIRRAGRKYRIRPELIARLQDAYFSEYPTWTVNEPSREDRIRAGIETRELNAEIDVQYRTKRAADLPLLPIRPLSEMLALPDADAPYRIQGLMPSGGRVMLAAQYKAGKTTVTTDLVRALVDGGQFLGHFDTQPVSGLVLIDTEMDERMLADWLRRSDIENKAAVHVVPLRNRPELLDVIDESRRERLSDQLREFGATVAVLDCLSPVLDASGLAENTQAGLFLRGLTRLLHDAGMDEVIVTHHTGHTGERLRGDSRLEAWPDATWRLHVAKGGLTLPRTFTAFGRGVNVPEGKLTLDSDDRLTYTPSSTKATAEDHRDGDTGVPDARLIELAGLRDGLTARAAACEMFQTDQPGDKELARARRRLNRLGLRYVAGGPGGGPAGSRRPSRWHAA